MKIIYVLSLLLSCSQLISEELPLKQETIEPLYGINLDTPGLTINVKSNGCTKANSFKSTLVEYSDFHQLTIIRTKKDGCRRMPRRVSLNIELDLKNKDNKPLLLSNPFIYSTSTDD